MARPVVVLIGDPEGSAGRAALALAARGRNVALCHQGSEPGALRIAREAARLGVNGIALQGRLDGQEAADDLMGAVLDHWGRIDAVVLIGFESGKAEAAWLAKAVNGLKAWRRGGRLIVVGGDAEDAALEAAAQMRRSRARAAAIGDFEARRGDAEVLLLRARDDAESLERILEATGELGAGE